MIFENSSSYRHPEKPWRMETRIQNVDVHYDEIKLNLLHAEAEKKGKIRNFLMYMGSGSDGSSAAKLSIDLKFNPWDTAITFRLG